MIDSALTNGQALGMSDESSRRALPGGFFGLVGCFAVLAAGLGLLWAIPVWFPDDSDELAPTLALLVVLTSTTVTVAGVLLLTSRRRARSLAIGLLVGYAIWFLLFIPWFLAGP